MPLFRFHIPIEGSKNIPRKSSSEEAKVHSEGGLEGPLQRGLAISEV